VISRREQARQVRRLLRRAPVVAILGPRQVGKTTLARQVAGAPATWFDLEDSRDAARLADPMLALPSLRGLVVIDEVQRVPELFRTLRVLADRPRAPARFLVLGSASPDLLRQSSESLAGRIAFHVLTGLSVAEVGGRNLERLWLRGGFPRSFLARTEADSVGWRTDFVETFLHRDLPQFGLGIPAPTLRRFWAMLAHWHGQIWNPSRRGC
jgi:predicted AAA+ superfamily ATPase